MADPAPAQQLGDQEGAAGQRRGGAQQPARRPGRVVVEGLTGDQDQVGDTIRAAGADDELRAAPVVADQRDPLQVQFGEELGEEGGNRPQGQVGAVGHRRGVRAERQLRDDAA
ncbi:MAG: hypothetical protein OXG91_03100, partial [bacterium]|nr:hypothetical protein [bacterium]